MVDARATRIRTQLRSGRPEEWRIVGVGLVNPGDYPALQSVLAQSAMSDASQVWFAMAGGLSRAISRVRPATRTRTRHCAGAVVVPAAWRGVRHCRRSRKCALAPRRPPPVARQKQAGRTRPDPRKREDQPIADAKRVRRLDPFRQSNALPALLARLSAGSCLLEKSGGVPRATVKR